MSISSRLFGEAYDPRQIKRSSGAVKKEISGIAAKQNKKHDREGTPHPVDVAGKRKRPFEVFVNARKAARTYGKDISGPTASDVYSKLKSPNYKTSKWVSEQPSPWLRNKTPNKKMKTLGNKISKVSDFGNLSKKDISNYELNKHDKEESIMSLADRILSEKRLTAAERNALPSSAFADPKNRKFPMNDPAHIRNAEVRKHFASSKVKSKINAKARKAGIGDHTESLANRLFGQSLELTEGKAKLGSGARFASLKAKAAKSGARNPAAVAAAAGFKKYGVKKMEKMAHAKHTCAENVDLSKVNALVESLVDLRKTIGDSNGQKS